jgi:hypothetical protein
LRFQNAPGAAFEAATAAQAEALGALVARIHLPSLVAGAERRWTIDAETLAMRPLGWIGPWLVDPEYCTGIVSLPPVQHDS